MSGGGFYDKVGNRFEQDYVCLQWLYMLSGRVDAVLWEGEGEDEQAVDVWIERGGERIAAQCKTRASGTFRPGELRKEFLAAALGHLRRDGGADRVRFVTNAPAPALRSLRRWAVHQGDKTLSSQVRADVAALGLDPESADDAAIASRIELVQEGNLEEHLSHLADVIAKKGSHLLEQLRSLPPDEILGRTLRAGDLNGRLDGIGWRQHADRGSLLERIDGLRGDYTESVLANELLDERIERPEVDELLDRIRGASIEQMILVHGRAGTGKSHVLASAVERWPADSGPVVPLSVDELPRVIELELTPARLALAFGEGRVTILIDQLDQILEAGSTAQAQLREVARFVRDARASRCSVVLGCRTDGESGSGARALPPQLDRILRGLSGAEDPLEIGPLPERLVTPVLSRAGISWNTLGEDVRRLVRLPVCLGIAMRLAATDGWRDSRSLLGLVERWWRSIAKGIPERTAALDALIERMESLGVLAVDRSSMSDHAGAIEALVKAGALTLDSRERVRVRHQVLVDMRLAVQIGGSRNLDEALARLGPRESQDVHRARQLRHSVGMLANHGSTGAGILDGIFRSDHVRPLLKRALLLGLGAEVDPPATLAHVVAGWLDEPESSELVSETLLRGSGPWVRACESWLDRAWARGPELQQNGLLSLLASVSKAEGDLVAAKLDRWNEEDGSVLDRAKHAFWQDPRDDSDAFFELRLRLPRRTGVPHDHLQWPELMRENPLRAARLLHHVLMSKSPDEVEQDLVRSFGDRAYEAPRWEDVPAPMLHVAGEVWEQLRGWWVGIEIDSVDDLHDGDRSMRSPLIDVVELLARCLARQLDDEETDWDTIIAQLPEPLRPIDGWLLLRAGKHLTERSRAAADAAAAWLAQEDRFATLQIGWRDRDTDLRLAREFAEALGHSMSERAFSDFETWVLDYRDEWTAEDERRRFEWFNEGHPKPSRHGLLAYRVLGVLPWERLSPRGRARLAEVRQKFDPVKDTFLAPVDGGGGGTIAQRVPSDVQARWSAEEWIRQLRSAPEHDRKAVQDGEHWRVREFGVLKQGLAQRIREDPSSQLSLVEALIRADPPLRDELYPALLSSIAELGAGERALDDDTLASLASRPVFVERESCALELARAVGERPRYEWPEVVLQRMEAIATSPDAPPRRAKTSPKDVDWVAADQWSDAPSRALQALANLARHHVGLRPRGLRVAAQMVEHTRPERRAAAGELAWCCKSADRILAASLMLRACADPEVAASRGGLGILFALLDDLAEGEERIEEVRRLLKPLCAHEQPHVARRGGHALMGLALRDLIDLTGIRAALEGAPEARLGAAEQLVAWLDSCRHHTWFRALVLDLADDPDRRVGDEVFRNVASARHRDLLRDDEIVEGLVSSRAGRRNPDYLVEALDDENRLLPVAGILLRIAADLAAAGSPDSTSDPWLRWHTLREITSQLARLVEECEREGELPTRSRALDAWDELIQAHPFALGSSIRERTT